MTQRLQFNYVPYPLWRRRWPGPIQQMMQPLWKAIYPVVEDTAPPTDAAAMADYLVRYGLLKAYSLQDLYICLRDSQPHIEDATTPPAATVEPALPARLPAQWEPMQAVIVNWPVMYPPLWDLHAQMVENITPAADVTITVPAPMWAHAVCLYLHHRGHIGADLMGKIRFMTLPTNDIWVRDYGPIIGYDQNGQRVAFDAIYDHIPEYPQTLDDHMPIHWAGQQGMPLIPVDLHTEGGNLWSDGAGTLIMTEQIFNENPGHDRASLERYLHTLFDYEKLIITPRLRLESTGHVDLILKLAAANHVLLSAPTSQSTGEELDQTAQLFERETNAAGKPYSVDFLPTPRLYFNWFTYPIRRSYTNALTVNGRVLVPVYKLPTDDTALRVYERAMPGYEIVPIDCAIGANGGGAVHCMTKDVPISL